MKKTFHPMCAKDGTDKVHKVDLKRYTVERKYDGSRYILQWDEDGKCFLTSRNCSVSDGLPTDKTELLRGYIYDDDSHLAMTVIDGEVLVKVNGEFPRNNGSSETNKIMLCDADKCKLRLQNPDIEVVYMVYDILFHKGEDLREATLEYRKEKLNAFYHENIQRGHKHKISLSQQFASDSIEELLELVENFNLDGFEGAMVKHLDSVYEEGNHSGSWLKMKKLTTYDGVILGYTKGTGKYSNTIGALIIGQYLDGNMQEVCRVSGMTDEMRDEFMKRIDGRPTEEVKGNIMLTGDVNDFQVIEFEAQEMTKTKYRHPRYVQMRDDKDVKDCIFTHNS